MMHAGYNVPLPVFLVKAAAYVAGSFAGALWRDPLVLVALVALVLAGWAIVSILARVLRGAALPVTMIAGAVYVAGHLIRR